jgi:hypothetical protein
LAKVRLTLDMIEDKLGISTYDERMELIKKLWEQVSLEVKV